MEIEQKIYEIAYWISSNIQEEDVFGEAGKITGFIQEAEGTISHIDEPERRRMAYPIKKSLEGYFGWTRFTMQKDRLADFEKKLKRQISIIRYLVVEAEIEPIDTRPPRIRPVTPAPAKQPVPAPEDKMNIEDLDKRLEEILGK